MQMNYAECAEVSPIGDVYYGKEVLAGFLPEDLTLSESGFDAVVHGRFFCDGKIVYTAKVKEEDCFFLSDRQLAIGQEVKLTATHLTGLFDTINQRTILRY